MRSHTETSSCSSSSPFPCRAIGGLSRRCSHYLDRTTVYPRCRWLGCLVLLTLYIIRVRFFVSGFYIVSYALAIYLLNLFIGFLSPQVDPETDVLPTTADTEEYRPFERKLPEYKFWLSACRGMLFAIFSTFFSVLDLPVFWPILVIYFILLFCLTMRQQVKRMVKYKYIPFSWGKQTYGDITRNRAGGDVPVVSLSASGKRAA